MINKIIFESIRIFMVAICCYTGNAYAVAGCGSENEIMGSAKEEQVFYINIFRGEMPIPVRYKLNNRAIDVHEFNSNPLPGVKKPIGFIRTGMFKEFMSAYYNQFTGRAKTEEIMYGLHVTIYESNKSKVALKSLKTVLIHDSKEFILITDENSNLWKFMLSSYCKNLVHQSGNVKIIIKNGSVLFKR